MSLFPTLDERIDQRRLTCGGYYPSAYAHDVSLRYRVLINPPSSATSQQRLIFARFQVKLKPFRNGGVLVSTL